VHTGGFCIPRCGPPQAVCTSCACRERHAYNASDPPVQQGTTKVSARFNKTHPDSTCPTELCIPGAKQPQGTGPWHPTHSGFLRRRPLFTSTETKDRPLGLTFVSATTYPVLLGRLPQNLRASGPREPHGAASPKKCLNVPSQTRTLA
jgi:hypothetical protein